MSEDKCKWCGETHRSQQFPDRFWCQSTEHFQSVTCMSRQLAALEAERDGLQQRLEQAEQDRDKYKPYFDALRSRHNGYDPLVREDEVPEPATPAIALAELIEEAESMPTTEELELEMELEQAKAVIRGLLLSADSLWEENQEGHDWKDSCDVARRFLSAVQQGGTEEASR